jgi:hypothetical protein
MTRVMRILLRLLLVLFLFLVVVLFVALAWYYRPTVERVYRDVESRSERPK